MGHVAVIGLTSGMVPEIVEPALEDISFDTVVNLAFIALAKSPLKNTSFQLILKREYNDIWMHKTSVYST